MGYFGVTYLFAISIILAAITGGAKFMKIEAADRPIVIAWWLLVVNETIRAGLLQAGYFPLTSYNIAVILLFLLYMWQFYCWRMLNKPTWLLLSLFLVICWALDYFVIDGYALPERRKAFRIIASVTLVVLSVTAINGIIVSGRSRLRGNHRFLICIAFVIYYTYRVFIDTFFIKGMTIPFIVKLDSFNLYLLQFYYLLMFIAALWIPRKKHFILP